ncbi:unannotated protein [freshwater metagenome]|uniref:Unannotated protein n=1 Tax=freshwater metagenome TaxID=449393 RepID=A0A6J6K3J3_9ZZZZ
MSFAITPATMMNSVSVPTFANASPEVEKRRMSAAYEPSRPIQTKASIVTAVLGSGAESMPSPPTKTTAEAMNAKANTSGNAASPIQ